MCPEHLLGEPQQHDTPFSNLGQQHFHQSTVSQSDDASSVSQQTVRASMGHKQNPREQVLQHSQHLGAWKFHCLRRNPAK